jgi:hypothetical protein
MFMTFRVKTPYSIAGCYRRFAITSCFHPQSRQISEDRRNSCVSKVGSLPHDVIKEKSQVVTTLHQWLLGIVKDDLLLSYLITYHFIVWKECKQSAGPKSDITACTCLIDSLHSSLVVSCSKHERRGWSYVEFISGYQLLWPWYRIA